MKDNLAETRSMYTIKDLKKLEEETSERYELIDNQLVMMAGGSVNHNLVTLGLNDTVNRALLKEPCIVLSSDVRLKIENKENYFYPDLIVKCGTFSGEENIVENPELIAEVLSNSTERYDRSIKLMSYASIKKLKAYLIVNVKDKTVEVYSWQNDIPTIKLFKENDDVKIENWIEFPVNGIFERLDKFHNNSKKF